MHQSWTGGAAQWHSTRLALGSIPSSGNTHTHVHTIPSSLSAFGSLRNSFCTLIPYKFPCKGPCHFMPLPTQSEDLLSHALRRQSHPVFLILLSVSSPTWISRAVACGLSVGPALLADLCLSFHSGAQWACGEGLSNTCVQVLGRGCGLTKQSASVNFLCVSYFSSYLSLLLCKFGCWHQRSDLPFIFYSDTKSHFILKCPKQMFCRVQVWQVKCLSLMLLTSISSCINENKF